MSARKTTAQVRRLPLIERHHDGRAWTYSDPVEAELVFDLVFSGIPIERIDNLLEGLERDGDGNPLILRDDERDELLDERQAVLHAYRRGNADLAEALARALLRSCQFLGLHVAAVRLARHGAVVQGARSSGGETTAKDRKDQAEERADNLVKEAKKILQDSPSTSIKSIAAILDERGLGGKYAIEKILRAKLKSGTEGR